MGGRVVSVRPDVDRVENELSVLRKSLAVSNALQTVRRLLTAEPFMLFVVCPMLTPCHVQGHRQGDPLVGSLDF